MEFCFDVAGCNVKNTRMQINLATADQLALAALAKAAGFEDVEGYASAYLSELVSCHVQADAAGVAGEELQASLAMCDQGLAELNAGKGKDLRQAVRDIAQQHGLDIDG
ncbi:MAG: hypothetical protein CMJ58_21300 [Planctomycetaceae bacterium]|nr:hypothetical protein [Planctomycetaceae bacterium]